MNQMSPSKSITAQDDKDTQRVLSVKHWTENLFSFAITRPQSLRFRSGEFVMLGLKGDNGKPILRAYSIASPAWADALEFYSIKVQDGPLTSKLQHIKAGDNVILRPKPVGTLVHDALLPAKRLWFFATGTGFAPFASLLRDPETYDTYDEVIITHNCRFVDELAYGKEMIDNLPDDPLVGETSRQKLRYYPTTTREHSSKMGRITDLIKSEKLFKDLKLTGLNPENDRAMICGSLSFNNDMKTLLDGFGLREGSNSSPGEYVIEKAFVG